MRPALLSLALAAGCATQADLVCQDIGYCQTQSIDQVHACQAQAKELGTEAASSSCSSQFTAYFSCADGAYQCNGNVPTFPGCEADRAALDSCLAQQRANNACGQLETKLAQCPSSSQPPAPILPLPCSAGDVCSSNCYLRSVADLCRPQPIELTLAGSCIRACPL